MTDAELADWQARKDAELEATKRSVAKERSFRQLLRRDPKAAVRELLGLPKKD
jgi:hypothetical protein